jgi:hypothetical protein
MTEIMIGFERSVVAATNYSFGVPQSMSPSVFCVTRWRMWPQRNVGEAAGRPTLAI